MGPVLGEGELTVFVEEGVFIEELEVFGVYLIFQLFEGL